MNRARPASRVRHATFLLLAAAAAAAFGVRVLLLTKPPEGGEAVLLAATFVLLALLAISRAWRAGRRPGDLILAVGLLSSALGWLYWSLVLQQLADPPYPSPADVLWWMLYPCAYVSLIWHVGRRTGSQRAFALDVLIAAAGVTAAVAGLLVPAIVATGADTRVVGVNAVYLGANVAHLLLMVSVLAVRRFRVPSGLWWRLVGVVVFTATDSAFLLVVADTGAVPLGTILDLGWLASFALLVLSIGTPEPVDPAPPRRLAVLVMPLSGTALALVVLLSAGEGYSGPRWIATIAIVLALGRMGLAFLQADALAGSHQLARTDELTGLVNRRGILHALRTTIADGTTATVVLLDLNRFKEINDTLGHPAGDELLCLVGARLAAESRSAADKVAGRADDVVARLGGDEFALLLPRGDAAEGVRAAERLLEVVAATYEIDGIAVRVSAAAGVVHLPEHGDHPDELLRRADVAMYAAKSEGEAVVVFREELDTRSRADLHRVERLRAALLAGGLELYYQPKVDLRTGAVDSVEALARLRDLDGELLLPAAFLVELAHGGQLRVLTSLVLDGALAQAAAWAAAGRPLAVAINVPVVALVESGFPDEVARALASHGVAGPLLFVEVTEETLIQDRAAGRAALDALRRLGVRVSIDDYGTGWSSLSYLRDLPLDEIKLDRTFVRNMAADRRAIRIVHSTVALAHGLDLSVVAEGVETPSDRDAVIAAGCDQGQGYLFARPVPADEVLALLTDRSLLRSTEAQAEPTA